MTITVVMSLISHRRCCIIIHPYQTIVSLHVVGLLYQYTTLHYTVLPVVINIVLFHQYMQRGGSWDNSDVKGAKKKKWLSSDKDYAGGGFRKEQSVSIFGKGEGLDWTGVRGRSGPEGIPIPAPKISRNYKPPNVNTMKGVNVNKKNQRGGGGGDEEQPKKKFFGLF